MYACCNLEPLNFGPLMQELAIRARHTHEVTRITSFQLGQLRILHENPGHVDGFKMFQIHFFFFIFSIFFPIFFCRPRMIPIDPSFWNGGSTWLSPAKACHRLFRARGPWTVDRGPWCGAMSGHEGCQPEGWMMVG